MDLFCQIFLIYVLFYHILVVSTNEIVPERVEILNSNYVEGRYNFSRYRITRFNRTTYIFETEFLLMVDIDKNYDFEMIYHFNRLSNNQYSKTPFQLPKMKLCDFLEHYYKRYMMKEITTISNFPQIKSNESVCPFQKVYFKLFFLN